MTNTTLDERLREILEDSLEFAYDGVYVDDFRADNVVAQLKQAFEKEGYYKVREGTSPNYDNYFVCQVCGNHVQEQFRELHASLHDKPELKNFMTGQEFYDRFEQSFWEAISETLPDDHKITIHDITYLDDFGADDILELAKRAAGIEEQTE